MRIDSALTNAASGLDSINRQLATIAQNVANAGTPGYVRETLATSSVDAGGEGMGVRSGVATRSVDAALQANVRAASGDVAGGQLRQTALSGIDAASGAPGSGQDLASLLGALRDGFSTLASDPANQTQQRQVGTLAAGVAGGVNTLAQAVGAARQAAQDGLVDDVTTANTALASVGRLSDQIVTARALGQGTADLEDRRDTAATKVTQLTGARFLQQPNGDLLAVVGGTILPTHASNGPLGIAVATLGPGSTGPALTVSGVAAPVSGGTIGAAQELRDTVLPGLQASLDGFAQALAVGFGAVGLTLFTDGTGMVPPAGTPGFSGTIKVNPAVTVTPSMVRDGAAPAGAAGSTTLINAALAVLLTGPGTVAGMATDLVANHAGLASQAAGTLATDQAVQSSLQAKLSAGTEVSVDSEMAHMLSLQNSYGANAKVLAAVQAMWTQLLSSVP